MSTNVYANGREIACKASDGKSVAQFPDVCLSPPTAPPTPNGVPVPYPNTAAAADCQDGSKRVKICGKPVMLRDKSYIAKSSGDEAGSAPQKNVITGVNRGKAYFVGWSTNVRVERQNVPRHLDPMTHNHASAPGGGGPWPYMSTSALPTGRPDDLRCTLVPYGKGCEQFSDAPMTPHHCVPDHCFKTPGDHGRYYPGAVKHSEGLCICVEGPSKAHTELGDTISHWSYETYQEHYEELAEHGRIHAKFDEFETQLGEKKGTPPQAAKLGELEGAAAKVIAEVTGCSSRRIRKQLRSFHEQRGLGPDVLLRADPRGSKKSPPFRLMGRKRKMPGKR